MLAYIQRILAGGMIMIDNYLLAELITFAKYKTLAKTAAELNITQPTVTRGMQKLEDELGVQLFDRHPNRITLTKTGKLAAEKPLHSSKLISNLSLKSKTTRKISRFSKLLVSPLVRKLY